MIQRSALYPMADFFYGSIYLSVWLTFLSSLKRDGRKQCRKNLPQGFHLPYLYKEMQFWR
ncbi:hypothetical protein [Mucilaginibacter lappiensis]|uniref:hypothetical protein n=1 Tax=Mucilaginibacter lappiensis TaxID=354630 RepID=UPI003D2471A5